MTFTDITVGTGAVGGSAPQESAVELVAVDFAGVLSEPLDDTFARFHERTGVSPAALRSAMHEASEASGLPGHDVISLAIWSEAEWGRHVAAAIARDTGIELDLSAFGRDHWFVDRRVNQDLVSYLHGLASGGMRLAMITNNVKEWEPLWRDMIVGVDELFELVANSCELGICKPDPAIFRRVSDTLGVAPGRCVMVDDLPRNCEGARAAGWQAVHFADAATGVAAISDVVDARPVAEI